MIKAFGYAAQDATTPLAPFSFERREPRRARRPDRDPLLRRLPFRPAHGARRMGRHALSPRARPRDRRPRHPRRRRGAEVQGRRPRRRRLHGRFLPHLPQLPRGPGAVLRGTASPAPTTARSRAPARNTYGGYSNTIVVDESFVLRVPDGLDPAAAAPLLCAGITTYSPLRHWRVQARAEGRRRRPRRPRPHGA